MVNLVRHLTILLLFDIPLLYYYINLGSSIILSFFWRYRNFFRCFFIMFIFNCFWIILQWTSWNFLNSISNFITNQITSCFCCFWNYSYWSSLNCICCRLHSMIKKFWAVFTTWIFTYSFNNIFTHIFSKIYSLLQIFDLYGKLNSTLFFIFYTLINN